MSSTGHFVTAFEVRTAESGPSADTDLRGHVMREAFVEWQERFGHEGTGVLERLRAVAEGSGSITGADVRQIGRAHV